jgi:acyl-CoA thioesterase FadM
VEWRQRIVRGDDEIATQVLEAAMTDSSGRPTRWLPELVEALTPHVAVQS